MRLGGWGRALALYAVALAVASFGLSAWLRLGGETGAGGQDVVSVWRGGARVARRAGAGLTAAAVATEAAAPGTTVVLERVVGEGRVLTLGRRLFGWSFVAGRDGVRATLDGSEAVLTPDDLVAAGLYRQVGVDAGGVLGMLARELACAPERLWKAGRFRRFSVARTVLSSTPAPAAAAGGTPEDGKRPGAKGDTTPTRVGDANWVAAKPGAANAGSNAPAANAGAPNPTTAPNAPQVGTVDTLPTGPRLARAVRETAAFIVRRLGEDGRFSELSAAGAGAQSGVEVGAPTDTPAYDWRRHAVATAFLAEADNELDDLGFKIAAQRAGWVMRTAALGRCGGEACVGEGEQVATGASASAVLAFSALGAVRVGASFREPARELAAFLRGQQRPDGGFWAGYDRTRRAPAWGERADVDAAAALALVRAYRITRAPADLAAAARALDHLARRPGWLGARNPLSVDPRLCVAADEVGRREGGGRTVAGGAAASAKGVSDAVPPSAEGAAARKVCLEAADASGGFLELGPSPLPDYAGGVRCGLGWMPDLRTTADQAEASTAALSIGLGAGRSFRSLTPLGARVTRGLEFMLRTQLPGTRPYLVGDPVAAAGGFPASPVETAPRIEVSAAAGSAMLRYLQLLEVRGMPAATTRRPHK